MLIELNWQALITLRSGSRQNLIYTVRSLEEIPAGPGVYIFGYLHGAREFAPIYVGKAERLRSRIRTQFKNLPLMIGLQRYPRRRRLLAVGEYIGGAGSRANRAIQIAERALIEYALASGYDLLNQAGTKRPKHGIVSWGRRESRGWLPRHMSTPKR